MLVDFHWPPFRQVFTLIVPAAQTRALPSPEAQNSTFTPAASAAAWYKLLGTPAHYFSPGSAATEWLPTKL